ncbi:MAG: hypothetical protein ACFFD6_05955 [Candidatus Thorarchaeota archaeon]
MTREERIVKGVLGQSKPDIPKRLLVVATGIFRKGACARMKKAKTKGRLTTGSYEDLTIGVLDAGVGSPSATMIVEAAAMTRPEMLIRADFCGGLSEEQSIGEAFVADSVIVGDGCGTAYFGSGVRISANMEVNESLLKHAENLRLVTHRGVMWTTDIILRQTEDLLQDWVKQGAQAVDMETSSILGIAHERGIPAASINCISDLQLHGKPLFGPGGVDPLLIRGIDLVIDAAMQTIAEWK